MVYLVRTDEGKEETLECEVVNHWTEVTVVVKTDRL